MSIVNPGGLPRYEDIEANTRKLAEEVILNKSDDGSYDETGPEIVLCFFLSVLVDETLGGIINYRTCDM